MFEVFRIEQFDSNKYRDVKIFNLQFVNKIKGKTIILYKKSQLVIQVYNNNGKNIIFMQSPTI
jgi:hypothetical protein